MNISSNEQFINTFSDAMVQHCYIRVDQNQKYSYGEKTKKFKSREITAKVQECFESLSKNESSSNRIVMLKKLENALSLFSSRIKTSVEKRWWYPILHFFGYQACSLSKVQNLLNLVHSRRLEVQKVQTQQEEQNPILKNLKSYLLFSINQVIPIDQIHSVKIFIDIIRKDGIKISQDQIIKQTELSTFNSDLLSQEIDSILNKAKAILLIKDQSLLIYDYHVLIRDKEGNFGCAMHSSNFRFSSGFDKGLTDPNKYSQLILEKMYRPQNSQIDEQGQFIEAEPFNDPGNF